MQSRYFLIALAVATVFTGPAFARGHHYHYDDERYYNDRYDNRWEGRRDWVPPGHRRNWHYVERYDYDQYPYSEVRCTNAVNPLGLLVGGVAGGALGSTIGHGSGRDAAMVGGAVLGGLLGNNLTQQRCSRNVFYEAPIGQPVGWARGDEAYTVVPTREYKTAGRYCREYQAYAMVGGRRSQTYGTACMQPDGSWEIVD
jgi:surface antigen